MKKYFCALLPLFMFFICSSSFGQTNMEDIVYLKNGSVIRGIVVEQVPNQSIKIQTIDRNIFVFKFDEIEKITKEIANNKNGIDHEKSDLKTNGYMNLTETFYCPGYGELKFGDVSMSNIGNYSSGFRVVNGYQFNEYFSLGVGLGIDKNNYSTLLPITFDGRATLIKGKTSPVFSAIVGYSVSLADAKGGFIVNPQFGIKTHISNKLAYLFNIGYKWQSLEYIYYPYTNYTNIYEKYNLQFQFFTVSTGLQF